MHKQIEKLKTLEQLMGLIESELRAVQDDGSLSDANYNRAREACLDACNLQRKILYLRAWIPHDTL